MDWNCGYLLTGDRGSMAAVWDIGNGRNSSKLTGHKGHITSVRILPPVVFDTPLLYTGAQVYKYYYYIYIYIGWLC